MGIAGVVAGAKKLFEGVTDAAAAQLGAASGEATIYQLLEQDHEAIKDLLKALAATTPRAAKRREQLFARLKLLVTAHARAEEATLYDAIKGKKPTRDEALEGYEEHHLADLVIGEMTRLSPADDRWTAKCSVLKENLEHHIDEEESDIFPAARKVLSARQAIELGRKFETQKRARLAKMPNGGGRRSKAAARR